MAEPQIDSRSYTWRELKLQATCGWVHATIYITYIVFWHFDDTNTSVPAWSAWMLWGWTIINLLCTLVIKRKRKERML